MRKTKKLWLRIRSFIRSIFNYKVSNEYDIVKDRYRQWIFRNKMTLVSKDELRFGVIYAPYVELVVTDVEFLSRRDFMLKEIKRMKTEMGEENEDQSGICE